MSTLSFQDRPSPPAFWKPRAYFRRLPPSTESTTALPLHPSSAPFGAYRERIRPGSLVVRTYRRNKASRETVSSAHGVAGIVGSLAVLMAGGETSALRHFGSRGRDPESSQTHGYHRMH